MSAEGASEGGGERISRGLCTDNREPPEELKPRNHEIMAWAEARCLTD